MNRNTVTGWFRAAILLCVTDGAHAGTASFAFDTEFSGGHGPFYAAARAQYTTGAGSGGSRRVAPAGAPTPLPAALWLVHSSLGGLGVLGRK